MVSDSYREYSFANDLVTVTAKFASWDDSQTPARLYVIDATEISVEGVNRPSLQDREQEYQSIVAEYYGPNAVPDVKEIEFIIYHLGQFGNHTGRNTMSDSVYQKLREERMVKQHPKIENWFHLFELHELTHWALNEDEQESDPAHWDSWNSVLKETIEYVSETPIEWGDEYQYDPLGVGGWLFTGSGAKKLSESAPMTVGEILELED